MQIGEFAARTGLSPDTLRYYEKIGLMPRPARDRSRRRDYSDDHLRWVEFLQILRSTGMSVNDMVRYVVLRSAGGASVGERLELLVQHRRRVSEERRRLERVEKLLDDKIALFTAVRDGTLDAGALHCASGDAA